MKQEEFTIALVELDGSRNSGESMEDGGAAPGLRTSLLSERMGLLARPAAPSPYDDRRMADWIASQLDLAETAATKPSSPWAKIVENLPGLKRKPKAKGEQLTGVSTLDSWKCFQVAYKHGITVVRLLEKALLKEAQIRALGRDLLDLIAAGNHRVVLNFQGMERLGSWMAFVVDEAGRRCAAGDGGWLEVCGLPEALTRMFPIAGVGMGISIHESEAAAITSPWPAFSGRGRFRWRS